MPSLKFSNGPEKGRLCPIRVGATSIGRDADSAVVINDASASGSHAEIIHDESGCRLRDLGSTNGTLLNGAKVTQKALKTGDQIRIGTTVLVFTQEEAPLIDEAEEIFDEEDVPTDRTLSIPIGGPGSGFLMSEEPDVRRIRSAHRKLSTLYKISQEITSVRDLTALLQRTLDLIIEAVRADRGCILVENQRGELVPGAIRNPVASKKTRLGISRTMARQAFEEGKGILVSDAAQDTRFDGAQSVQVEKIRSALCVPLTTASRTLGVVSVHRTRPLSPFVEEDLEFLIVICNQAAVCIENAHLFSDLKNANRLLLNAKDEIVRWTRELEVKVEERTAQLSKKTEELERLSVTDGMTGLFNHQHFQKELGKEVQRMIRYHSVGEKGTFSVAMIDLDNLKPLNDTFGHLGGDAALKRVAAILRKNLREVDLAARYGGDEFSILLPRTDADGARMALEKILKELREQKITYGEIAGEVTREQKRQITERLGRTLDKSAALPITISVGVASYREGQKPKDLLSVADAALYRAKGEGKDRVVVATAEDVPADAPEEPTE